MKWFYWFVAVFVLMIIQGGILAELNFLPVVPMLLVIFSAIAVVSDLKPDSPIIVLMCGVVLDFVSGLPDGIMLLSLGISAVLTYVVVFWWLAREYKIGIIFFAAGLMSLLFSFTVLGVSQLFNLISLANDMDYSYIITNKILWYIVFNLVLTYPVYLYFIGTEKLIIKIQKKRA